MRREKSAPHYIRFAVPYSALQCEIRQPLPLSQQLFCAANCRQSKTSHFA